MASHICSCIIRPASSGGTSSVKPLCMLFCVGNNIGSESFFSRISNNLQNISVMVIPLWLNGLDVVDFLWIGINLPLLCSDGKLEVLLKKFITLAMIG